MQDCSTILWLKRWLKKRIMKMRACAELGTGFTTPLFQQKNLSFTGALFYNNIL